MFIGWEGVGICSYLLVQFWYTRIAAVKSALNALFTNRIGDFFLTLSFFAIFFTFGSLDYATVFSLAPYININIITFIAILLLLGATAKSAQIGLHGWLPYAMEGDYLSYFLGLYNLKYNNNIEIKNFSSISVKKIWVYDIKDLSLVYKAPFYSKTQCALTLQISRNTIRAYLDKDKLFDNKWIFSSFPLNKKELSKWSIPEKVWDIITGELLGDGHIRYNPIKFPGRKGRLEFTFSSKALHYIKHLKYNALASICTKSKPTPWPNPKLTGKEPTQYWFSTKCLTSITLLHNVWYKQINNKYIKKLPLNIEELITPIGLAHWIMGDGYFAWNTVKICTDNFSKEEVLNLIRVLDKKFDIKSSIIKRNNPNNTVVWRIKINKLSMEKLKTLVFPYIIPEMLYKLGIKN